MRFVLYILECLLNLNLLFLEALNEVSKKPEDGVEKPDSKSTVTVVRRINALKTGEETEKRILVRVNHEGGPII